MKNGRNSFRMSMIPGLCVLAVAAATPAWAKDADLKAALAKAKSIVQSQGTGKAGQDAIKQAGLVDLDNSGQHLFAVSKDAKVIFDLSGQTAPGTDMNGVLDMEGNDTGAVVLAIAHGKDGGFYKNKTSWPHPVKGTLSPSTIYCEPLGADALCVMTWEPQ